MTAHTPNLPALISAIPGDHTRAPQTEFTRARQVLFLENLSLTGSVRSAAAAGGVSHQTAYRARRGQGEFRVAWDAAMVAARAHAAEVLAARAIDGVEEKVFYHGEHVDTRVRYSDRLLLAHLARLDRLVADPDVNAVAEDFDAALARFERGEAVRPAPAPASAAPPAGQAPGAGDFYSPGPCNTRSMSPPASQPVSRAVWRDDAWHEAHDYPPCRECGGACNGPEEDLTEDDCRWTDLRLDEMAEARPAGVPDMIEQAEAAGVAPIDVEDAQLAAYLAGEPEWWLAMPGSESPDADEDPDADAGDWDEDADDEDAEDAEDEDGGEAEDDEDADEKDRAGGDCEEEGDDGDAAAACAPAPATAAPAPWVWRPIDDGRLQPFYGRDW